MNIKKNPANKGIKIPEPFDLFYDVISDADYEKEFGVPASPSPCQLVEGYDITHVAYLIAKPEFYDDLADNGLDAVELVKEGTSEFLAYAAGDRVYPVEKRDMPDMTTYEDLEDAGYLDDPEVIEESTDITCESDKGTCRKVAEDEDMIEYVVSATEPVNSMSLAKYRGYKVMSDQDTGRWLVLDKSNNVQRDGFLSEKSAKEYIDTLNHIVEAVTGIPNPEADEDDSSFTEEFDFDVIIEIKDTVFKVVEGDLLEAADDLSEYGVNRDTLYNDTIDVLSWNVPDTPGKFHVTGTAMIAYDYYPEFDSFAIDYSNSGIDGVKVTPAGK